MTVPQVRIPTKSFETVKQAFRLGREQIDIETLRVRAAIDSVQIEDGTVVVTLPTRLDHMIFRVLMLIGGLDDAEITDPMWETVILPLVRGELVVKKDAIDRPEGGELNRGE